MIVIITMINRIRNHSDEIMRPLCRPETFPRPVTLRCLYSGSLNRGNTFPSKLLFLFVTLSVFCEGSQVKDETLKRVQSDWHFVTLRCPTSRHPEMSLLRVSKSREHTTNTRFFCRYAPLERQKRDSSSLTSFVPPE